MIDRTFSFAFRLVSETPIICMDRRTFLTSSGAAAFGTLVPRISRFFPASKYFRAVCVGSE